MNKEVHTGNQESRNGG